MSRLRLYGPKRKTGVSRSMMGGCYECHGGEAAWFGLNTLALAARHHDRTGHATWTDISTSIHYGDFETLSGPLTRS